MVDYQILPRDTKKVEELLLSTLQTFNVEVQVLGGCFKLWVSYSFIFFL